MQEGGHGMHEAKVATWHGQYYSKEGHFNYKEKKKNLYKVLHGGIVTGHGGPMNMGIWFGWLHGCMGTCMHLCMELSSFGI